MDIAVMDISTQGVAFVASFEGFKETLYNDVAGNATIGYGHLVHSGPVDGTEPREWRDGITQKEALDLLRHDLQNAVGHVKSRVKVPVSQAQFDVLVSFVFNVGVGNFQRSDLLARLNRGEYDSIPWELSRWTRAGGVRYAGLIRRRDQESDLWKTGDYDPVRSVEVAVPAPTQAPQMPKSDVAPTTKVPWISQLDKYPTSDDYEQDCLAAVATMELRHRGVDVNVDQVSNTLGIPGNNKGFHILDLTAAHGRVPKSWNTIWIHRSKMTWAQVAVECNNNRPVIAYINAGLLPRNWRYRGFSGLHFVLIIGIVGTQVHYLDPNWEIEQQGRCWLHQSSFGPAWAATNYQGLIVRDNP